MAKTIKKLSWKTEKRIVKDLLPLDFNPRKITKENQEALIRSIDKFNLVDIPTINLNNSIISGKQRVEALMIIGRGDEKIDVRVPNRELTPTEVKEYMLIANSHAGVTDAELMEVHFADINIEFDVPIFEEVKSKTRTVITGSTMEKQFFLNIRCIDENHCQELFDRLSAEGLEIKIVT